MFIAAMLFYPLNLMAGVFEFIDRISLLFKGEISLKEYIEDINE